VESVLVIIPVLNEESTISTVIESLHKCGLFNICVVDNGSDDGTALVAADAGATVVVEAHKGYGQACWAGLQSEQAAAAKWILFCDGDGSDDLSELPELLAVRDRFDFVLGDRRATAAGRSQLTATQNFGNWLATRLICLGWGYRYNDLGPLRLIRKRSLDQLHMSDRGFGWTVEMQTKAVEQGLHICEQPVNYGPRQGGHSKIAGTVGGSLQAGQVILSTLARLYWQKTGAAIALGRLREHIAQRTVQRGLLWAIAVLIIGGSVLAAPHGDFLNQPEAVPLFWVATAVMGLGFVLSWALEKVGGGWFWGVAVAARLILLAMYPSDDIWRYLWEGHIQNLGFNPYLISPNADALIPFREALPLNGWHQINHPDLAAIYPPITQLGFRTLAAIAPSVLLFKSAFVAADLAICGLLSRRFGCRETVLYAWNPLVLYSFAGGGHYDSWFLLPLVVAWLWTDERSITSKRNRVLSKAQIGAAIALGVSIGVKWMSLPALGFLAWRSRQPWPQSGRQPWPQSGRQPWPQSWRWVGASAIALIPMALATLPFCQAGTCSVIPVSSPFVIYGRSAALIPHWIAGVWPASVKANWIYVLPLCGVVAWNLRRQISLGQFIERYFVSLMLLSPIIHAWYFSWLAPFAVASRNVGIRLVSLSAFVYFALPHGLALGLKAWQLSGWQRWLMWGPFVFGLAIELAFRMGQNRDDQHQNSQSQNSPGQNSQSQNSQDQNS